MSSLTKLYHKALKREKYKAKPDAPQKMKPSMLGSPCMRKIFYSFNRVEEDSSFPINSRRIMEVGSYLGEMLYDAITRASTVVDYKDVSGKIPMGFNGKPNPEFPVSSESLFIKKGYIDVVYIHEGKLWLGEFKTINSRGFGELTSPKKDHAIQGVTYLYLFNKMLKDGEFSHIEELKGFEKAEGINFLYICRDNGQPKEYSIIRDDKLFSDIVSKISTIKAYSDKGILPPKTAHYCSSCPFLEKCKKNLLK